MRALVHWLRAIAIGIAVFEWLDLLGSSRAVTGPIPAAATLTTISPFVTGTVTAWLAGPAVVPSLGAAVAAVWARIEVDYVLGALQGLHPPAEAVIVLIVAFGLPWTIVSLAGAAMAILARRINRRRTSRHERETS